MIQKIHRLAVVTKKLKNQRNLTKNYSHLMMMKRKKMISHRIKPSFFMFQIKVATEEKLVLW